jgi:hypothetical protein
MNTREVAAEYRLSHWAQIMRERKESGLSIKALENKLWKTNGRQPSKDKSPPRILIPWRRFVFTYAVGVWIILLLQ